MLKRITMMVFALSALAAQAHASDKTIVCSDAEGYGQVTILVNRAEGENDELRFFGTAQALMPSGQEMAATDVLKIEYSLTAKGVLLADSENAQAANIYISQRDTDGTKFVKIGNSTFNLINCSGL